LPLLLRVVEHTPARRPAGVDDEDLHRSELLRDVIGKLGHPLEVGAVGGKRPYLALQLRGRLVERFGGAAPDRPPASLPPPGPPPGAGAGAPAPDARPPAEDERYAALDS